LEDQEGYIWAGTTDGLNRYDGARFVVFKNDPTDKQSLIHNNIISICEDKDGYIWAATNSGISRYNKTTNTFESYLLEPVDPKDFHFNAVTNIICDRRGTIWATSLNGFYEFIPSQRQFKAYKHHPANLVSISSNYIPRNSLVEDPLQPYLWVGTKNGLNYFDTERKIFFNYRNNPQRLPIFINDEAFPLAIDKQNHLVYGDYHFDKLVTFSLVTHQVTYADDVIMNNYKGRFTNLTTLFFDASNNMWANAWYDNYMIYFKEAVTGALYPVKHEQTNPSSIGSDFFWDAIQTRDGTIYIGGLHGISVYNPSLAYYRTYEPSKQFPKLDSYTVFQTMVEDDNGKLWIGNDGEGLFSYDFISNTYEHFSLPGSGEHGILTNKVQHISYINKEIWVSTLKGIYIFNPANKTFQLYNPLPAHEGLPQSAINWSYQDCKGNIWFNVNWQYLYKYSPAQDTFKKYNFDGQFIHASRTTRIKTVDEDKNGNVWFGTHSGRLYQYTLENERITGYTLRFKQALASVQHPISELEIDEQGIIWIATEGSGLVKFDPASKKVRSWRQSDGMVLDVVKSLIIDPQQRIWIGSFEGATIFDLRTETIINPKLNYGQQENNFRSWGKCLLRNGNIVYANLNNFIVIDPSKITHQQDMLRPVVSGITIFEKLRPLYQHISAIELSYLENFFTINFSSLAAIPETAIEYAYQLESYDSDWVSGISRNFATYTDVKGGNYVFKVKARYKDGTWSKPAQLLLHIKPPFWETWWFRTTVFASLTLLIAYGAKIREKRLLKIERDKIELRERIASSEMKALRSQMNPHFLYNSLNAIRLFVLQNDSDNAEKYLVKFARLMRLILDNSRQEWVSLPSELQQLKLYMDLEQLRFNHKFDYTIQIPDSLSLEQVLIPPMIIQPYIENAILHGIAHKKTKGHIHVSIALGVDCLKCIVEDDGVGRKITQEIKRKSIPSHKSVGLQVTEERLLLISHHKGRKGSVQIDDLYDENKEPLGTKVSIELPFIEEKDGFLSGK
jgi:ligand-binding sensor domain-containing protein